MPRGDARDDEAPLEVIDLEPELGPQPDAGAPRARRHSTVVIAGAALVVLLVVATVTSSRHHRSPSPVETVGRFYPEYRGAGPARLVLPSGVVISLAGDMHRTLPGLGATFEGDIGPVGFRIARGKPSDLFTTLGPQPIRTAVAVAGSDARAPDLSEYGGRFAVLSDGGWTLIAFLSDDEPTANTELRDMAGWRLRPSRDGAVVRGPGAVVGDASVVLMTDDATPRRLELTDDNCAGTSLRTEEPLAPGERGRWCADGVYVRITGPSAFVEHATATLRVQVDRRAD